MGTTSPAGIEPAPAIWAMTSQSPMALVSMAESYVSSWLYTVGHSSYVHGVKTLLITPVLLSHAPVRMAVHDGFEMVVCPTMLGAELVLVSIRAKKFVLVGSASTLLRFVPSTPITSTCWVVGSTS